MHTSFEKKSCQRMHVPQNSYKVIHSTCTSTITYNYNESKDEGKKSGISTRHYMGTLQNRRKIIHKSVKRSAHVQLMINMTRYYKKDKRQT